MKLFILIIIFASCCTDASMLITGPRKLRAPVSVEELHLPAYNHLKKYGLPNTTLTPVVCIPGVGGNQLFAKLDKSNTTHWLCDTHADWYRIWLTLTELVPGPLTCFEENFMLRYDNSSKTFSNASGALIAPVYPGTTLSFEYLDPDFKTESIYFGRVVTNLIALGYERGVNLVGIPYDWRLAPGSLPHFFTELRTMIETAYKTNNNTRVIVLAHSMGNLFFKTFLARMDQAWRDTFIKEYVGVAAPWTGAPEAIQSVASGYDFSIPFLPPMRARKVQRSFESNYFLFPEPSFWGDYVMVTTPTRNYTARDYQALLKDLGLLNAFDIWTNTDRLTKLLLVPPNVKTYCFYGYDVNTHMSVDFPKGDFDKQPTVTYGDGDGTVPSISARACQAWNTTSSKPLYLRGYQKAEHVDILINAYFLADLLKIVTGHEL